MPVQRLVFLLVLLLSPDWVPKEPLIKSGQMSCTDFPWVSPYWYSVALLQAWSCLMFSQYLTTCSPSFTPLLFGVSFWMNCVHIKDLASPDSASRHRNPSRLRVIGQRGKGILLGVLLSGLWKGSDGASCPKATAWGVGASFHPSFGADSPLINKLPAGPVLGEWSMSPSQHTLASVVE